MGVKMARTAGLAIILCHKGWLLLATALLFCGLCVSLKLAYPGLQPPVLAVLVFAGSFLLSLAVIAGFRIFKMVRAPSVPVVRHYHR
jgi:hypothetical protein